MTCSARWRWWRRRITAVQKRLGVGPWYTFGAALKTLVFIYIARPPRRVGCGSASASIAVDRMGQPPGLPLWRCGRPVDPTNRCRTGHSGLRKPSAAGPADRAPKEGTGGAVGQRRRCVWYRLARVGCGRMTCSARWRWWRRRITAVQKRLGIGPWYTFGAALKTLVFPPLWGVLV